MRVVILAGGVGGAKLADGVARLGLPDEGLIAAEPIEATVVVNTADDLELHGLHVSPDLDTVMYTLAGLANAELGWGLADETWSAASMLATYRRPTWFRIGDRDLATHVVRTERLREGARLTEVTAELCAALEVPAIVLPMTDDRVRTRLRTPDGWLDFQTYFVARGHRDRVLEVRFDGIEAARPAPEALAAIDAAGAILLAPSNPFLSLGPILALPELLEALRRIDAPIIGVSGIVDGAALRGPADRLLESLGGEASAFGAARHYVERYPGLLDAWVLDERDASLADAVAGLGLRPLVAGTVMRTTDDRRRLAADCLALAAALARA